MSVWISDEKLLSFASLISPSKMILFEKKYQTFDTVFHLVMKQSMIRWVTDENDYYFILGTMLTEKTLLSYM